MPNTRSMTKLRPRAVSTLVARGSHQKQLQRHFRQLHCRQPCCNVSLSVPLAFFGRCHSLLLSLRYSPLLVLILTCLVRTRQPTKMTMQTRRQTKRKTTSRSDEVVSVLPHPCVVPFNAALRARWVKVLSRAARRVTKSNWFSPHVVPVRIVNPSLTVSLLFYRRRRRTRMTKKMASYRRL